MSASMMSAKLYDSNSNIINRETGPANVRALAQRLLQFRLDHDYTLQHLAGLTRISKSALHRIEHGATNLNARTIRKLERFLEAARAA